MQAKRKICRSFQRLTEAGITGYNKKNPIRFMGGTVMKETLTVLGTGNALATRCYNTCFAVENSRKEVLLVDAGGGNGILRQLQDAGMDAAAIHHIILTHAHCDHMLGLVWMVRKIGTLIRTGKYEGDLTIHCAKKNEARLRAMCEATLEQRFCRDRKGAHV